MAAPLSPVAAAAAANPGILPPVQLPVSSEGGGFARLLSEGAQKVSDDAMNADRLVREFALSDSVPVHQVTYALEQARLSLSLMMQVRNRLIESYQQLMNMQL